MSIVENPNHLAEWLMEQMRLRGLAQHDLVVRGQIGKGTLSAIMVGRTRKPSRETLEGIARALGLPLTEVLSQAGYPIESDKLAIINHKIGLLSEKQQEEAIKYLDYLLSTGAKK